MELEFYSLYEMAIYLSQMPSTFSTTKDHETTESVHVKWGLGYAQLEQAHFVVARVHPPEEICLHLSVSIGIVGMPGFLYVEKKTVTAANHFSIRKHHLFHMFHYLFHNS